MNRHVRQVLNEWLDCLAMGVILSTAFTCFLLINDVSRFATTTANDGGSAVRITFWLLMAIILAPMTGATDRWFRRRR
ncbi:hypothetical protein [Jannaschia aquimarina]|uniref:Uncharacterized protein n=1 Tax=Jannaschia aquimarina TaxID=935700 RepID=A0A0D1CMK4_9RHOB|nr:hypothetical protein [Jannaschia aquimarina]KIT16032.1 hypothetical protein jaqu_23020 [Jannaschia aquimarina]SNT00542.1 hypothetical protein SAMN05421775_104213 [Jannaschia aquimarina]